jgi:hypothetical protein
MDFLNHREGGVVFYHVFLHCRNSKRLKKYKYQEKAVETTVNSKEENS